MKLCQDPEYIDLAKRGNRDLPGQSGGDKKKKSKFAHPLYGREFFFASNLVKVQQVSKLFMESSEDENPETVCFVVLVFEKNSRKRQVSKTDAHQYRLRRNAQMRRDNMNGARYEESQLGMREGKMRRFCNYFLTLYDTKHLAPFAQFMKTEEVADV